MKVNTNVNQLDAILKPYTQFEKCEHITSAIQSVEALLATGTLPADVQDQVRDNLEELRNKLQEYVI